MKTATTVFVLTVLTLSTFATASKIIQAAPPENVVASTTEQILELQRIKNDNQNTNAIVQRLDTIIKILKNK